MPENAMLGNGVIGILSESCNKWERRVPLTPSHCARLLHRGRDKTGISRIIVQPSPKRIYHDALYEDVGCEISEDLSECGLIVGVKQPKLDMILPERAYAFFSHTHKAQKENMPLLDKVLAERATLFDHELIVGNHGERVLAFGKYAGRAGMIDFLRGLGQQDSNTTKELFGVHRSFFEVLCPGFITKEEEEGDCKNLSIIDFRKIFCICSIVTFTLSFILVWVEYDSSTSVTRHFSIQGNF